MRKSILTAIIVCIIFTASWFLNLHYNKTPLSLAKVILKNPEPLSKIEVYYLNDLKLIKNQINSQEKRLKIDTLTQYIAKSGFKSLIIEGHFIKGNSEARNKAQSKRIANALKNHFIKTTWFKEKQIKSSGLGSTIKPSFLKDSSTVVVTIRR